MLVPFFFIYNPALVGHGTPLQVIQAVVTAAVGIVLLSGGFEGYVFFLRRISLPTRVLFMASGALMFHPRFMTDLIGLGIAGAGSLIGLHGAYLLDLPAAPVIVLTLGALLLFAALARQLRTG